MSATMSASETAPPPVAADRLAAAYAQAGEEVRRLDRDLWLASLYAPADRRRHLHALHAFAAEIDRIRDVVSDPLPGEIRARWWADMLCGARGDEGTAHPIACALTDTIARFSLPVAGFERLIEAKIFDLYDDPMPDVAALETYCAETFGALVDCAATVLAAPGPSGAGPAARAAGLALGLTTLLRAVPRHASRGQIFLPGDVLARHGVGRDDMLTGTSSPALLAALADLRGMARRALDETRRLIGTVALAATPAFLPAALVEPTLRRMERPDYDPFRTVVDLPPWRRQWCLWRAARRARGAA